MTFSFGVDADPLARQLQSVLVIQGQLAVTSSRSDILKVFEIRLNVFLLFCAHWYLLFEVGGSKVGKRSSRWTPQTIVSSLPPVRKKGSQTASCRRL